MIILTDNAFYCNSIENCSIIGSDENIIKEADNEFSYRFYVLSEDKTNTQLLHSFSLEQVDSLRIYVKEKLERNMTQYYSFHPDEFDNL